MKTVTRIQGEISLGEDTQRDHPLCMARVATGAEPRSGWAGRRVEDGLLGMMEEAQLFQREQHRILRESKTCLSGSRQRADCRLATDCRTWPKFKTMAQGRQV